MVVRSPTTERRDRGDAGSVPAEHRIETPSDVEYLVFAGGGARAVAHVGALGALADLGYLKRVSAPSNSQYQTHVDYYLDPTKTEGVAGSSTGGFVAALLALGVGVRTIYNIIVPGGEPDRSDLLPRVLAPEKLETRHRPTFGGIETETLDDPHADFWTESAPGGLLGEATNLRDRVKTEGLNAMGVAVGELLETANESLDLGVPPLLVERLFTDERLTAYARNVLVDYGAFSGRKLRRFVGDPDSPLYEIGRDARPPEEAARKTNEQKLLPPNRNSDGTPPAIAVSDLGNLTFRQFERLVEGTHRQGHGFRTSLALTGTNVSTQESQVFSAAETPDVPVADAVRATMAFPLLLKPTFVEDGDHEGLWVDGSVTNAYPLHAFDDGGELPESVLGFQLGLPADRTIDSFVDLVRGVLGRFLEVSTTGQIRNSRDAGQTVELPVGDLPYLSVPDDETRVRPVLERGAEAVYSYFDERKPASRAERTVGQLYRIRPTLGSSGSTARGSPE